MELKKKTKNFELTTYREYVANLENSHNFVFLHHESDIETVADEGKWITLECVVFFFAIITVV